MKKRIIFVGLCLVLLLIFTSLSYGGYDPRYFPVKEHPDQELLSPANSFGFDYVVFLIMPGGTHTSLLVQLRNSTSEETPDHKTEVNQGVRCKDNYIEREK